VSPSLTLTAHDAGRQVPGRAGPVGGRFGQPAACRLVSGASRTDRHRGTPPDHSFKKSSAEKIMKAVLEDKMAYTNERDGKG